MLVENGADINHTDKSGHTALSLACRSGNEKSVKLLLGKEARIDLAGQQFGLMAHHCVAFNGQEHILKLLLEKRAAANAVDQRGQTPLHLAARRGMHQTARLLLTHGANINQTDKMGRTALFHICEFDFEKSDGESKDRFETSAKLLLEHGASTNIKDQKQQLPLSRALANGASLNLVTMLSNANFERKCAMKSAEVQRLQDQLGAVQDQLDAVQQCFICNGAPKSIVFNCGHQVCETCSIRIINGKCPFCRKIVGTRTKMHDS
jgi:ankyrin repeat protein